ncbi:hypothetical protein LTR99_001507 [Exophiala xenobiotica]|uniref:Copper acquisition factor BIM1-like domain-containing protein n=1 Tax=Vermiconidia calcicola TaxID=1690605 RepID=A0AAV9QI53_9PEZI|nr:hypothetical protein H2202_004098 [Exophiala xenobiotica]KAK5544016.1 hypothetical protein LTR25_001631 [Vermiconidia calcicola]KAK5547704.1 hypothetical protein LTR23_002457 [Chaetothyriales sp. CCFEE 6169]KAK5191122.1 hypothetical protein LTR92_008841 [Exophiala xenobiotica]KAK5205972.1 hypothetical protein LTR41_008254 [Exophiala xenobiotica]
MIPQRLLAVLSLPLLASAHFHMLYPTPRSDVDDTEATFPCGGFAVSTNRTMVSNSAFPVALEMGHDRTVVQMLLALGSNPGDNFNITLEQTFQQQGEGDFCLPTIKLPSGLNLPDGTNGTLQVVTDGEGGGGLYICADLTFTSAPMIQSLPTSCTNGTGVTASALPSNVNANETNADGSPQSGSGSSGSSSASASGSPSATASGASSSETGNNAAVFTAGWGVIGAAVLGAVALT